MTSPDRHDHYKDDKEYKDDDDYNDRKRSPKDQTMSPTRNHDNNNNNNNNSSSGGGGRDDSGCTLHVSNLNHKTRESDLRDKFSQFGKILDCIILVDPNTKASRGFGFVTFAKPEEAEDAIRTLDSSKLDGSILRVEKAKRSKPRDPTPGLYMGSDRDRKVRGRGGGYPYPPRDSRQPYGAYPYPPSYPSSKYPMPYPSYYNYGSYPPPSTYPGYSYPPKPYPDNRYSPYMRHDGGGGRDRSSRGGGSSGNGGGGGNGGANDDRDRRSSSGSSSHHDDRRGGNNEEREYFRRESSHH